MPSTMRSNLALATLLTGFLWTQGISEELPCDVKASYTCFWDISTKFRKAVEDTGDVLSAACSITKELPTKNKCESLYVGCMDDEKKQFLTMESGYASLHNITADNRTCTPGRYQRDCDDSAGMKNCSETGIEAAFSTFEEQVYSKRRWARSQGAHRGSLYVAIFVRDHDAHDQLAIVDGGISIKHRRIDSGGVHQRLHSDYSSAYVKSRMHVAFHWCDL
ncbi:uncharacterized protein LOC144122013 isoform X7 [Amblyomma americanum]